MLKKVLYLCLFLINTTAFAITIPVQENRDINLTLSKGNYNRLVIKDDKIVEAIFPPNALSIRRDEVDGSLYLLLAADNPFTLFLATEKGRHFSVTLKGEISLGKTIELIPQNKALAQVKKPIVKNIDPNLALISKMELHDLDKDTKIKKISRKVERYKSGLTLIPKEIWEGKHFKGEVVEVYNRSKAPIALHANYLAKADDKAIKVSVAQIKPKEKALLYRIKETKFG